MASEKLTLSIGGRDYIVACEAGERDDLLACARHIDQKMQAVRADGKVMGADRVAVLVALQIAQEMFSARVADGVPAIEVRRRVRDLTAAADEILTPQEKLFD